MKKQVILTALFGFLLSLGLCYFYTIKDYEKHELTTIEASIPAAKREVALKKDGKIIYQYFYTKDAITKEQIEPVPNFLEGMNLTQLQSIYTGWQIAYFSPEKAILRCSIEGNSDEVFFLSEQGGYLAIFYEDHDKKMRLKEQTSIPISVLPETEQMQLTEGITVLGEENLARLLADFSS